MAVLGAILLFAVGNAAATSTCAVAGDAAAARAASSTGTIALLVDALNRGDSARAAALFTADAVLFQAQAQVWVDQETGIASDPFGTGLYVPSRQLPPGPDGTTAWAVGQDAVQRWLHELAGRHVAITADSYRAAGDRAEWDFAATFDAAPHLTVAAALRGHASAELRGGSLAALTVTIDAATIQQRTSLVAAAIAATMTASATTTAPDTVGVTPVVLGGTVARDAEPEHPWLIALLLGLAALAFGTSMRRAGRSTR